jgi:hypothetical protein
MTHRNIFTGSRRKNGVYRETEAVRVIQVTYLNINGIRELDFNIRFGVSMLYDAHKDTEMKRQFKITWTNCIQSVYFSCRRDEYEAFYRIAAPQILTAKAYKNHGKCILLFGLSVGMQRFHLLPNEFNKQILHKNCTQHVW